MAVVHIGTIKLDHAPHLLHQGSSGSLNAQRLNDVWQVVAHSTSVVHTRKAHDLLKVDTLSIQHPFILLEVALAVLWPHHQATDIPDGHLLDTLNALQLDLAQHAALNLLQERVVTLVRRV